MQLHNKFIKTFLVPLIVLFFISNIYSQDIVQVSIQQNIKIMPAPTLISPSDGEDINTRPMFTWMQAVRPGTDARYKIRIVEINDRQSPETAMQKNPAWFEEENIMTRMFQYPTSAQELMEDCKSEVWMFTYKTISRKMITREEAIEIIMKEVIKPESLKHDILAFLGRKPLQPGDSVRQDIEEMEVIEIKEPTWFAWINDDPQAKFAHTTRYVFINALSGELEVYKRDWWPLVNGKLVWQTREELKGDRYIFFYTLYEQ